MCVAVSQPSCCYGSSRTRSVQWILLSNTLYGLLSSQETDPTKTEPNICELAQEEGKAARLTSSLSFAPGVVIQTTACFPAGFFLLNLSDVGR